MARLYNRIQNMNEDRLPKVVLNWDFLTNLKGWLSDMSSVTAKLNLEPPSMDVTSYDLEGIAKAALDISRLEWKEETKTKPKLRTYVKIKDFGDPTCLVKTSLSRCQRSLTTQLMCGILPLELEVGRYLGVDKRFRYCKVCRLRKVEDELHFLFDCPMLRHERRNMLNILDPRDRRKAKRTRLRLLLSPAYIKQFAHELEKLYLARQKVLYN